MRSGKVYLFKGDKYVRWDIAQDKLDFEALIAAEWVSAVAPNTRLADVVSSTGSFGEGIDAAVNRFQVTGSSLQIGTRGPSRGCAPWLAE